MGIRHAPAQRPSSPASKPTAMSPSFQGRPPPETCIYIYIIIYIYTHTLYIYIYMHFPSDTTSPATATPSTGSTLFFPSKINPQHGGVDPVFFFNLAGTRTTTRSTGRFTSRSRNWIKRVWRLLKVSIPRPLLSIRFIFFNFFNFF